MSGEAGPIECLLGVTGRPIVSLKGDSGRDLHGVLQLCATLAKA
ncbi:hypothetical protein [Ferrimicrobium sp.]|nr:hypothetical protein [Ferrimicrobium sp.]